MNPIAVYQVSRPFARIRYELYEDWIQVAGSRSGVDFDFTSSLAWIDSRSDRRWVHSARFYLVGFLAILAGVLLMAFVTLAEMRDRQSSFARPYGLAGSLGVTGLAIALLNSRKIENVKFRNFAGIPIFDIPRDRARSEEFDRFVGLLLARISEVQREPRPAGRVWDGAWRSPRAIGRAQPARLRPRRKNERASGTQSRLERR